MDTQISHIQYDPATHTILLYICSRGKAGLTTVHVSIGVIVTVYHIAAVIVMYKQQHQLCKDE